LFVVYGLWLKVVEPISGLDRSGAVSICGNLRKSVGKMGLGDLEKGTWGKGDLESGKTEVRSCL